MACPVITYLLRVVLGEDTISVKFFQNIFKLLGRICAREKNITGKIIGCAEQLYTVYCVSVDQTIIQLWKKMKSLSNLFLAL